MTNGVPSYRSDYIPYASDVRGRRGGSRRQEVPEKRESVDRMLSLSVLSAIAIIQILLYQLNIGLFKSDHTSIILFMVMAGYFITSFVIVENFSKGGITYSGFILKKFLKLWPTILCVVGLSFLTTLIGLHKYFPSTSKSCLPALLCYENIYAMGKGLLPLACNVAECPLSHLWFMSFEVQFMLIWPAVVTAFVGRGSQDTGGRPLRKLSFILAIASAVEMALFYLFGNSISRVYFGFDTRIFSFALGSWLACMWPWGQFPQRPVVPRSKQPLIWRMITQSSVRLAGLVSFISMILISVFIPQDSSFYYLGGMYLLSIMSVCVVADAMMVGGLFTSLSSMQVLVRAGKRAYSLYAWHYPIFMFLGVYRAECGVLRKLIALALTILLAEVTYFLFEYEQPKNKASRMRSLKQNKYGNVSRTSGRRSTRRRPSSYNSYNQRKQYRRYSQIRH